MQEEEKRWKKIQIERSLRFKEKKKLLYIFVLSSLH